MSFLKVYAEEKAELGSNLTENLFNCNWKTSQPCFLPIQHKLYFFFTYTEDISQESTKIVLNRNEGKCAL